MHPQTSLARQWFIVVFACHILKFSNSSLKDEDKVEEKNQCNETEDVTDISLSWPLNKQGEL